MHVTGDGEDHLIKRPLLQAGGLAFMRSLAPLHQIPPVRRAQEPYMQKRVLWDFGPPRGNVGPLGRERGVAVVHVHLELVLAIPDWAAFGVHLTTDVEFAGRFSGVRENDFVRFDEHEVEDIQAEFCGNAEEGRFRAAGECVLGGDGGFGRAHGASTTDGEPERVRRVGRVPVVPLPMGNGLVGGRTHVANSCTVVESATPRQRTGRLGRTEYCREKYYFGVCCGLTRGAPRGGKHVLHPIDVCLLRHALAAVELYRPSDPRPVGTRLPCNVDARWLLSSRVCLLALLLSDNTLSGSRS